MESEFQAVPLKRPLFCLIGLLSWLLLPSLMMASPVLAVGLPTPPEGVLAAPSSQSTPSPTDVQQLKQVLVNLHIQYEKLSRENYQLHQQLQQATAVTIQPTTPTAPTEELIRLRQQLQHLQTEHQALKAKKETSTTATDTHRWEKEVAQLKQQLQQLQTQHHQLVSKTEQHTEQELPTVVRERLLKAKQELEKASNTIHDQNNRIALLNEKINTLQSLQEQQPVSLVGISEEPQAELQQLQKQLDRYEKELAELRAFKSNLNKQSPSSNHLAGGGATVTPVATSLDSKKALQLLQATLAPEGSLSLDQQQQLAQLPWYTNPELMGNYALFLKQQQKSLAAEALLKLALVYTPNDEALYYNLGNLYLQTDRLKEAEQAYQQALTLNNDYNKARYNLGLLYYKQGNKVACKQVLEQFITTTQDEQQKTKVAQFVKTLAL
ncbi:MAG: tetratricopeptide repeat protein [Vampirovibrionales bacterium]